VKAITSASYCSCGVNTTGTSSGTKTLGIIIAIITTNTIAIRNTDFNNIIKNI
jgi:hypothetical protein